MATAPAATRPAVSRAEARFQGVAHIVEAVFHCPGQVGMAGSDAGHALVATFLGRIFDVLDGHGILPVDPVPILQEHPDGAAQGVSVAHSGLDMGVVAFDLLTSATAVTALAPGQMVGDVCLIEGQVSRHAFDDNHEPLTVGLPRRKTIVSSSFGLLR